MAVKPRDFKTVSKPNTGIGLEYKSMNIRLNAAAWLISVKHDLSPSLGQIWDRMHKFSKSLPGLFFNLRIMG